MFNYDKRIFDGFDECRDTINDIFVELQDVIRLYEEVGIHDDEIYLFIKILEDNHNLLSEIVDDDINLYKFSLDNYNNPFLYQGYYYLRNISRKIIMCWERIFNCLGIIYGMEFNKKREKNNIGYIYKELKKIDAFKNSVSFTIIKEFYGENSFNLIRSMRESNDHDISWHLDILSDIGEDYILKDLYGIYDIANDGKKVEIKLDQYEIEDINDRLHRLTYNETNLKFNDIKRHIQYLVKLSKEVIHLLENIIKIKEPIIIEHKYFYEWNVNKTKMKKSIKNNSNMLNNYPNNVERLANRSEAIRGKAIEAIHDINRNPVIIGKPLTIRVYQYFSDATYRLHETVRSLIETLNMFYNNNVHDIYGENLGSLYFCYITLFKCHSCYEKIGKLMYTFFEIDNYSEEGKTLKNLPFEKVIELSSMDTTIKDLQVIKQAQKIISSSDYKNLIKYRNKIFHCLRPEFIIDNESLDLIFLNLIILYFKNIKYQIELLESIYISLGGMHQLASYLLDQ